MSYPSAPALVLARQVIAPGWEVAFTTAAAGSLSTNTPERNSAKALDARERIRCVLGVAAPFQFMNQVHGNDIAWIEAPENVAGTEPKQESRQESADAMISRGSPLAVLVADCVPVLIAGRSPRGVLVAAVHAGRRGVLAEIVPKTVKVMRDQGVEQCRAIIGPAICGSCYEVPETMRAEVAAVVPASWATTSWGTAALDLPQGVAAQLESLAVPATRVEVCTLEDERLFSHRRFQRELAEENPAAVPGRFAGLVYPSPDLD